MSLRTAYSEIAASLVLLTGAATSVFAQDDLKLEYHGAGWLQVGKIEHSYRGTDVSNDYNHNWMQNTGTQLAVNAKLDANWEGALAMGVAGVHLPRGAVSEIDHWSPFWVAYVGEARVTYAHPVVSGGTFRLTLGLFPYNYNPDAKNLGVYLMRGYVYPGTLESGFGNVFGGVARSERGGFSNELILKSEDEKPLYDLSVADVVAYKVVPGFEVGAGVNFYRLIKQNEDITSPGRTCAGAYGRCSYVDTTGVGAGGQPDTVTGSMAGTKVMARFHADPKTLFGLSGLGSVPFGKSDLILYGEAAIIGLKNYPLVYDDVLRRIPVMAGFNFPTFSVLDYLSLEVEYYASKNSSNNVGAAFGGAWVPIQPDESPDPTQKRYVARDDWKWSVNLAKTLFGSAQFSAQVANDHLRPGGSHDVPWVGKEAFSTPEDWYWTCKLAYFF